MLAEQIHQENMTSILVTESEKRINQNNIEAEAKKRANNQIFGAATSLGASLLKNAVSNNAKTEKEQKRARKKGVIIDAAAAVIKNFATASNFYEALGQNAVVAGAALSQIANINSASSSSSISDGGGSAPVAAIPQQTAESSIETEIRGLEDLRQEVRDAGLLSSETTLRIIDSIADHKISNGG
ncbi:MAG TPA: hypothetical protein EYN54_10355 [Methylococcaceae bacterium]|nr:hypothetical protein [Methylococcaceae bacterium]